MRLPAKNSKGTLRFPQAVSVFSLASWLVLSLVFWKRPDAGAALTVFPAWFWWVFGLGFALLTLWRPASPKVARVSVMVWVGFGALFVEEIRTFWRSPLSISSPKNANAIRVISLNCSAGDETVAREVVAWRPDVLLLQESPSREAVQRLARELFGPNAQIAWGADGSVLSRGRLSPISLPSNVGINCALARVDLGENRVFTACSMRLLPAVFRFDLWNPECWRQQRENRVARRQMLRGIVAHLPKTGALLAGGDFNAPQHDAIFAELSPRLNDAFSSAGTSWGNTILKDWPVLRIDQIWCDSNFAAHRVSATRTQNSDHRMVVSDLFLEVN